MTTVHERPTASSRVVRESAPLPIELPDPFAPDPGPGRSSSWALFAPLAAVAAAIVGMNVSGIVAHVMSHAPKSAFDAGLTIAAARRLQGLPIYSDAVTDQASTMYGPLVPVVTSWLFQLFGLSNRTGKILSLLAALTVVALVLAVTARRDPRAWAVGAALLFACTHNVGFYFVEARPDMVACLLALVALLLYARFDSRRQWWVLLASLACFGLAFLAKQPLGAAALVPAVAEACRGGSLSRERMRAFGFATLPPAVVALTVLEVRAYDPAAYFYMVTLPGQYHIRLVSFWHGSFELALMSPWLLLAGLDVVLRDEPTDPHTRWWAAGAAIFLPTGLVALAKDGGWWNSLLPFLVAAAGYATLQLPRIFAALERPRATRWRSPVAAGLTALLLGTAMVRHPGEAWKTLAGTVIEHGDARYTQVVELARHLRGRVLCPEDPTIPLLAQGEATRSLYLESDATFWPTRLPSYVAAHIVSARYVIQVKGPLQQLLDDDWLRELGFRRVEEPRLAGSVYALWRRAAD
jgi:hypothetical protein